MSEREFKFCFDELPMFVMHDDSAERQLLVNMYNTSSPQLQLGKMFQEGKSFEQMFDVVKHKFRGNSFRGAAKRGLS